MKPWKVALVATASTSGIFLMVLLMIRWCSRPGRAVHDHRPKPQENIRRPARLHTDRPKELIDVAFTSRERSSKVSKSSYFMRPFEWKKYPNQMADAIDRGWTAFALSYASVPSGPSMSPIPWKLCSTKGPSDEAFLPEVIWGMAGPEAELVQLIRLNPGMSFQESLLFSVQTLQSALPLPGPSIGQSSFPQEAYFEISILLEGTQKKNWFSFNGYVEDSRKKLIAKNTPSSSIIECNTVVSKHRSFSVDDFESEADSEYKGELRKLIQKRGHQIDPAKKDASNHMQSNGETTEQNENQVVAVGLTAKGAPSFYLPGTYWGSVGFQSNGKILLNGTLSALNCIKLELYSSS
ncbi:hypothetical protein O6H91_Y378800 [Diphasiastrum complanatum]|nr:hypothetical protein O6H91_Y378800 [Diphasiastrum complanatum]